MVPSRALLVLLVLALASVRCASAAAATPPSPPAPTPPRAMGAPAAPAAAVQALACTLLTGEDVQAVQGSAVVESKGSDTETAGGTASRCFLRTAEFARSVSVDVVLPQRGRSPKLGGVRAISPREHWQAMFHRQAATPGGAAERDEREEKERGDSEGASPKPLAVAHLGDEAFWVGTGMTGAIYVLQGDAYLRLSAGGPGDSAARLQRSRELAQRALPRLLHALRDR